MTQTHTIECITFEAPEDWTVERQNSETEISATVTSPGASFLTISLFPDQPVPAELIETAVETFRAEYEELDVYRVDTELCGRKAEACDLDFVCLDLVNSVFLRSFSTESFTVFILCQTDGAELAATRATFNKLTAGLVCNDADPLRGFGIAWE